MRVASVLFVLCFGFASCLPRHLDASHRPRRIAVAIHAVNAGDMEADDARVPVMLAAAVAERNANALAEQLSKIGHEVLPMSQLLLSEGYKKGTQESDGYVTAPGMRLFDGYDLNDATVDPDLARALCRDLRVNGIVAVTELWRVAEGGKVFSEYYFSMYDRHGIRLWYDAVHGMSDDSGSTGFWGRSATASVEDWMRMQEQAFDDASKIALSRLQGLPAFGNIRPWLF